MNSLSAALPRYSLWDLTRYFLRLGATGFGGPVALVGYMHRDLVVERQWITEADYREGLALSQLAPGPLAAQLAIYIGYVHYGIRGATVAGIAFVLPSFFLVVALAWAYVTYGGLAWMQAVFYGVGAAVIGIITYSAYRITSKSVGKGWLLWGIYLLSALMTILTQTEDVRLFLIAGGVVWLAKTPPAFLRLSRGVTGVFSFPLLLTTAPPASSEADAHTLVQILLFFSKAGAFVFGSGLAIVPFLYGGVVKDYQWLSETQFVDAVAVAMISPGPVVITVAFIGYLVAGFPGAVVAALATFLPCYLFTVIPAPYFKKYGKRADIAAFVEGVTVAATGAISGAVVVLGQRAIHDVATALIAMSALLILCYSRRISEPMIIAGAAGLGLCLYPLLY